MKTSLLKLSTLCGSLLCSGATHAFSGVVFFGDSNTDSGRYLYEPMIVQHGRYTTPGGLMWSEYLGNAYGFTVTPSTAPGGGNNYAAGYALIAPEFPFWFGHSVSHFNPRFGPSQVDEYLQAVNGRADSSTLYTVYIGTNDLQLTTLGGFGNVVSPQNMARINELADLMANQTQRLTAAGARYILVPSIASVPLTEAAALAADIPWDPVAASSVAYYNARAWSVLSARGIPFIPVDFAYAATFSLTNPSLFGITETHITASACGTTNAYDCVSMVQPDAGSTHYFADDYGHVSAAIQRAQADYVLNLLRAPQQTSQIANQAVTTELESARVVLDQARHSFRSGVGTLSAWVQGSAAKTRSDDALSAFRGTPRLSSAGFDYQIDDRSLVGAYVGVSGSDIRFGQYGGFSQQGNTIGIYGIRTMGSTWVSAMAGITLTDVSSMRVAPIGMLDIEAIGTTTGRNTVVSMRAGQDFNSGALVHGPVVGYSFIRSRTQGFTEYDGLGSYLATLRYDGQTVDKHWISAGWQISMKDSFLQPTVRATLNQDLANDDRMITSWITSSDAPSYKLPAIKPESRWAELLLSARYALTPATTVRASLSTRAGAATPAWSMVSVGLHSSF